MPMYEFACSDCKFAAEHFVYPGGRLEKSCPKCDSKRYSRRHSRFKSTIEYANPDEHFERVIDPAVNEIYSQIGRETLNEDANTLENLFGTDNVKSTIVEKDD